MSLPSYNTLPANEALIHINKATEQVCERLEAWGKKSHDVTITDSIARLVQICRKSTQQCSQYLATEKLLPSPNTSARSLNHVPPKLRALFDDCKKRTMDVASLLDKLAAQAPKVESKKDLYTKRQEQLDNICNTYSTVLTEEANGNFRDLASPYTKTKINRLREEAEAKLLPNLSRLVISSLEQAQAESHRRWLPEMESTRMQVEDCYDTCLEITSSIASSFLVVRDPLYIHIYPKNHQVPYREVTGVPTASGSYGVVYKAVDVNTGATRAIKQLNKIYSSNKRDVVLKELTMLGRCDHPNILKLTDAYQVNDDLNTIFLVTDPWAPYTLNQFIHESDKKRHATCPWFTENSPLTETRILRILIGLADGLGYLHEKSIKHKDIKPENILLYDPSGDCPRPIIADLGISKIFEVGGPTDYIKSSYQFLAPEQIQHIESTLKADIWQMGCCFALILVVSRAGSAGCRQLWNSFDHTDADCSCNIAIESITFMKTLERLCGSGTTSQCHVHWIVTAMLEIKPAERFEIETVRRKLEKLV